MSKQQIAPELWHLIHEYLLFHQAKKLMLVCKTINKELNCEKFWQARSKLLQGLLAQLWRKSHAPGKEFFKSYFAKLHAFKATAPNGRHVVAFQCHTYQNHDMFAVYFDVLPMVSYRPERRDDKKFPLLQFVDPIFNQAYLKFSSIIIVFAKQSSNIKDFAQHCAAGHLLVLVQYDNFVATKQELQCIDSGLLFVVSMATSPGSQTGTMPNTNFVRAYQKAWRDVFARLNQMASDMATFSKLN